MNLDCIANPGLMISQVWPQSREKEGETLRALETVLKFGFFKAVQTVEIPYSCERKAIAGILQNSKIPMTYCLARVMNDNKLNFSDYDEANRLKSCRMIIGCIEDACEAGADSISLISGPIPQNGSAREAALYRLADSMSIICEEASKFNKIKVIIEPLDYFAHKKNTLGTTTEAVEICKRTESNGFNLFLCIDTAHAALNGENPVEAVKLAADFTPELHFCNCVTDSKHDLYGDYHIPFGKPGILGIEEISSIMKELTDCGYFNEIKRPNIFCEVIKRKEEASELLMKYCRDVMESAWDKCCRMKGEK